MARNMHDYLLMLPLESSNSTCLHCPLMWQLGKGVFENASATSKPIATLDMISILIVSKRNANRKDIYIKSLEKYCKRFAVKYPNLSSIGVTEIETWLSQFATPQTRQTWLNRISTLFSFAVKRGFLAANPCDRIERVTIDRKEPAILTIEQAQKLLSTCPDTLKSYLALAMFSGVRPDEIMQMTWGDINLETKTAKVNGKTRRRRIVPLEDAAILLLQSCAEKSGNVAPSRSTVRRWQRKARELIGGKWTADILRHTAASMLLAKYQDAGKVATMLGNSPQILLTHYNNPVTKEDADLFWSLHP